MTWLSDLLAVLAFSQFVFLAIYFFLNYRSFLARMIAIFCVCVGAYLLATLSVIPANTITGYILIRLATLAPFALWLIAFHLFVDNGRVPAAAWFAMAFFVLFRGLGSAIALTDPGFLDNTLAFVFVQLLPQLILLGFASHAIYLAFRGYETDLVEQRRTLRVVFVACMGVLVASIVGMGIVSAVFPGAPDPTGLYALLLFLAALSFNLFALRLNEQALTLIAERSVKPEKASEAVTPEADSNPIEAIRRVMEEDRLYAQAGLTISDLADTLSIQEYRLRRIINQGMCYRNFNQFLNSYRIKDASRQIAQSDEAISSIAADVGYSSLSVFNKAFRERYGMTPSEYRANYDSSEGREFSTRAD